ncbi:hypothetical protein EDB85DRAFT_2274954 [Lactarius pseudohatsudake]|nr:hypothetical protein EDB85DRAFT_2274954 [Lactarius pseudohatsudake]
MRQSPSHLAPHRTLNAGQSLSILKDNTRDSGVRRRLPSGFPARLPRSSSNGHMEASERRSISRVTRLRDRNPPERRRFDVSALRIDVQRDEGGELRREAVPDPVPTAGSGAETLVPGEGRGYGLGVGEGQVDGGGQLACENLELRSRARRTRRGGESATQRVTALMWRQQVVAVQGELREGLLSHREDHVRAEGTPEVDPAHVKPGCAYGTVVQGEGCQLGCTDAEAGGKNMMEDGCLDSEATLPIGTKPVVIKWVELQADGLEPGQLVNARKWCTQRWDDKGKDALCFKSIHPSLLIGACVSISNLPDMGCDIRDIEKLSQISGASSGGDHRKDAKRNGCGDGTESVAGGPNVA